MSSSAHDSGLPPGARKLARRRVWTNGALGLWAITAFVITGSLAALHDYALPRPEPTSPRLMRALARARDAQPRARERFTVTHVLYAECRCSQRILRHLLARGARSDVSESVLLVGPAPELIGQLTAAGFQTTGLTASELVQQFDIQAAPLLIVADPAQHIRYLGGYTTQKQGLEIRDGPIIDRLLAGEQTLELPLLGCAVSRALQRIADPLGLSSRSTEESGRTR